MGNDSRPIGVFDSGMGGISVLRELAKTIPNENYIYYGDSAFAPYGIKSKEEIIERCINICELLISKNVKMIIIACNTATSAAADILREKYKNIPIIGMEPALNLATKNNNNKNIMVMATPMTLKQSKFNDLLERCKNDNIIIKMPCPELVTIVEEDRINDIDCVEKQLKKYFFNEVNEEISNIDSIVLGCTHFIFYKSYINKILGDSTVILDGNAGTVKNVLNILIQKNIKNNQVEQGNIEFMNSQNIENEKDTNIVNKLELSKRLFNLK
ncbi:MAG: glutamate racemase [Romboutsia sp.]|nr:glutamate racemase [Romboutsia sp.]